MSVRNMNIDDQRRATDLIVWKISNGHISVTHYPIHFLYVQRPYFLPSDSIVTVDAYDSRLDT